MHFLCAREACPRAGLAILLQRTVMVNFFPQCLPLFPICSSSRQALAALMRAHAAERATAAAALAAISTSTSTSTGAGTGAGANASTQSMSLLTKVGLRGLWCVAVFDSRATGTACRVFRPFTP